jgi:hypothetical protein
VRQVESNLKRADLLIRAFMRRMATDKFIMVFMFLIVCGILTIIIYKVRSAAASAVRRAAAFARAAASVVPALRTRRACACAGGAAPPLDSSSSGLMVTHAPLLRARLHAQAVKPKSKTSESLNVPSKLIPSFTYS